MAGAGFPKSLLTLERRAAVGPVEAIEGEIEARPGRPSHFDRHGMGKANSKLSPELVQDLQKNTYCNHGAAIASL
jgi:hypothetical protein